MKLTNILKREKFYRIVIYSKDVISGSVHDGVYPIDVPDHVIDNNNYHLAVESFCHVGDAVSSSPFQRVIVPHATLSQPDTYSTSTKTNSTALCVLQRDATASVPTRFHQSITSKTYGIPLTDASFLRSKQLKITMKTLNDTIYTDISLGSGASWVMTLVIYPFEK